jgi:WD40 repeat protein
LWTIVPLADGARAELVELANGTVRRSAALPPIPADDEYVACAVSPDGARLALGSQRGTIVVHDVTGSEVRRIKGDWGRVRSLTFAVDGSVVAWSSSDGHVRLAEIRRGWPVDIALGDLHDAPPELRGGTWDLSLHDRLLAIDDSALFYVGNDAVAYTWTLDVPRDPAALRAWVAAHTPIAVDPEDLGWITSAR